MKTRILQTALFLIICTFMTLCNFRVSAAEHEGLSGTQSIGLTEEEKNKQIYSPIEGENDGSGVEMDEEENDTDQGSFSTTASVVTPTVTLNSIANQSVGATVTVTGRSSTPCYRMSAKCVHNGVTKWLGDVYSSTYSKSFTVTESGSYSVTLYARSYPESDSRSGSGSKTVSFTVYKPVLPSITLSSISTTTAGNSVTVKATATSPCYRMAAKYVINGETHWIGETYGTSFSKSFTPIGAGTYTITVYARSYAESDPRTGSSEKSTSFVVNPAVKTVKVFQDLSYRDQYAGKPTYINTVMGNINSPFQKKWGIKFSPSFYNVTGMPLESCKKGYYVMCENGACGSQCKNTDSSSNHDKNFDRNYHFAVRTYGYSGFDTMLTVVSATMCHESSEKKHSTNCLGMTTHYDSAMVKLTPSREIGNVRVIQHEISHQYGCSHCSNSHCIMNGGFDANPNYNLSTIWCNSCASAFDRNTL
ncbi:hypothetical protein AALA61_14590 [Oscillospiraceae bacterium 42-9]